MPTAALFGEDLHVTSASRGTIAFLPGGGLSGWSWRAVAELLPEYRSLLVDLPDHGQSANVGPFTIEFAARMVAEVIRKRVGRNVHVVGLSLGAQVAVQLTASAPDVVASAFVTGCTVRSLPIPGLRSRRLLKALAGLYVPLRTVARLVRAQAHAIGVPPEHLEDFAADVRMFSPGALARIVSENQAFRIPPELHRVEIPVLIAVGEKEPRVVKDSAGDLFHALRNARAYAVQGRTHPWPVGDARLCADAIRAFLTGGPMPPAFEPIRLERGSP